MAEFSDEIARALHMTYDWTLNLDGFNDVLRGGFGTPEGGFIIVWKNAELSKRGLGSKLFETLVEIIRAHCAGGDEGQDDLELVLA